MKLQKETKAGRDVQGTPKVHGKWYGDACAAAFGMELIGERWTLLVIRELMLGGRRFSDIRASLPNLSAKTLTERLETLQELGRWALRAPFHDPTLPLTPTSLMLSMRTLLDHRKIGDMELWVAFDVGEDHFAGRLRHDGLSIHPVGDTMLSPDLRFSAGSASDFLPVFYGKKTPEEAGNRLAIGGDAELARRFIDLFALPEKVEMKAAG
ncbi:MAG: transcriptional regulator [Novosphingobium sp.]|nr:transcriptional regulator [Novosphingobium sp.]